MPAGRTHPARPRAIRRLALLALLALPLTARAAEPDPPLPDSALPNPALPNPALIDTSPDTGFESAALDPATLNTGALMQTGMASWYGAAWKGRRTASGSRFDPEAMTAASHTLPLGTRVLVTLEGTARSVLVTITDRQGTAHRIIDLSKAAARRLGLLGRGTGRVTVRKA